MVAMGDEGVPRASAARHNEIMTDETQRIWEWFHRGPSPLWTSLKLVCQPDHDQNKMTLEVSRP